MLSVLCDPKLLLWGSTALPESLIAPNACTQVIRQLLAQ